MSQMLAEKYSGLEDIEIDVEDIVTEDDTPVDNLFSEKQRRLLTEPLYTLWPGPVDDEGNSRSFLVTANVGRGALSSSPAYRARYLSLLRRNGAGKLVRETSSHLLRLGVW